MAADVINRLQAGINQARPVIAGAGRAQYDGPTPCPDWDVRQLINHMIGALVMFRDVGADGVADPSLFGRDLIGADAVTSFDEAARAAVAAWSAEGKVDGTAKLPFGEFPAAFALQLPAMDMLVHSWDLAKATGQTLEWDSQLVAETTAFCRATFDNPQFRGTDFAPPIEVGDDASDMDRLVAFLGRQP
jgi:uncharacterized protein (TIGR03086 family)